MQRQAELRVLDQREEAERAIANPFGQHPLGALGDLGLHVRRAFANDGHIVTLCLQEPSVRPPRPVERFVGVVEEVDVPPIGGYEAADAALEFRESHCRIAAARR